MCGGSVGKIVGGATRILDAATFGGFSAATGGLIPTISGLLSPTMPQVSQTGEQIQATIPERDPAATADQASLTANRRERLRAARRYGRASTIGAGAVGAPAGGGKTAIGS